MSARIHLSGQVFPHLTTSNTSIHGNRLTGAIADAKPVFVGGGSYLLPVDIPIVIESEVNAFIA